MGFNPKLLLHLRSAKYNHYLMLNTVFLRPWKPEDAAALATICNNRKIWLNVRDRFPHPYMIKDAVEWIVFSLSQKPLQNFAIIYKGEVAGSIGITPKDDIYRKTIEIGYFVGEVFWGKGIATEAVAHLLKHIVREFDVVRIYAEVFEKNIASMKVLEKNGFYLESVRKKAVIKNHMVMDDYLWVKLIANTKEMP